MTGIDVHFDMETGDPDDVFTLCFLTSHPNINLRAVTVVPGTDEQIGLVKLVLNRTGHGHIPVGSYRPGVEKECVSDFYHQWLKSIDHRKPDGESFEIVKTTLEAYPDIVLLTGAPLCNFRKLDESMTIKLWVAQGGFAGDNVVPEQYRLDKFKGLTTCPTYNFNGDPNTALRMLRAPNIHKRYLVSKNVCHGMVYDGEFHEHIRMVKDATPGLRLVYEGMCSYLNKWREGKKFHDPLAACVVIDPSICEFREVEVYRANSKWGSSLKAGTNTFISIAADRAKFIRVFTEH